MKRASQFAMVRNAGRSEAGRFLILSTAPAESTETASIFGIITTRRIGHAVARNLLRRRVREILRAHGAPLAKGLHIVIIVRNRAAHASYAELEKDFLKLLARCSKHLPTTSC